MIANIISNHGKSEQIPHSDPVTGETLAARIAAEAALRRGMERVQFEGDQVWWYSSGKRSAVSN